MKCQYCGNEFEPIKRGHIYCSSLCRKNADLERRKIRRENVKLGEILLRDQQNRTHIKSEFYMPPLEKMSGDELLHYGKFQRIILTGGGK